jgi:hypothetical protein
MNRTLRGAALLAREELGRARNSYLRMGGLALAAGLAASFLFTASLRGYATSGRTSPAFLLDFILVVGFATLARFGAWTPRDTRRFASDDHLSFLRGLLVSVRELVAGWVLTVFLSVLVAFVPLLALPYLFSAPLQEQLGAFVYLLFAAFWVGCALTLEGVGLFTELGLGGRAGFLVYTALLISLGALVGYSGGRGTSVVVAGIRLVQGHGPLLGLLVLTFGVFALALSAWATVRRLKGREFPA